MCRSTPLSCNFLIENLQKMLEKITSETDLDETSLASSILTGRSVLSSIPDTSHWTPSNAFLQHLI